MALGETWREWSRGNFREGLNYLFVSQETVDSGRRADSALEALVKRRAIENKITQDQANATIARIQENAFVPGGIFSQEGTDIVGGFQEGFEEGAANVQSAIKGAIAAPLNFTFGAIPWQVWILAALWFAWWAGWLKHLKR